MLTKFEELTLKHLNGILFSLNFFLDVKLTENTQFSIPNNVVRDRISELRTIWRTLKNEIDDEINIK